MSSNCQEIWRWGEETVIPATTLITSRIPLNYSRVNSHRKKLTLPWNPQTLMEVHTLQVLSRGSLRPAKILRVKTTTDTDISKDSHLKGNLTLTRMSTTKWSSNSTIHPSKATSPQSKISILQNQTTTHLGKDRLLNMNNMNNTKSQKGLQRTRLLRSSSIGKTIGLLKAKMSTNKRL